MRCTTFYWKFGFQITKNFIVNSSAIPTLTSTSSFHKKLWTKKLFKKSPRNCTRTYVCASTSKTKADTKNLQELKKVFQLNSKFHNLFGQSQWLPTKSSRVKGGHASRIKHPVHFPKQLAKLRVEGLNGNISSKCKQNISPSVGVRRKTAIFF